MKITDIRPEKLIKKQIEAVSEDIAVIIKHKKKFIRVPCPACGSKLYITVFKKYGFEFVECKNCLTIYNNPRPTLEMLKEYYKNSKNYSYWSRYIFPASEKKRIKEIFKPRAKKIAKIIKDQDGKTNSIMDIGAAFGTFCQQVQKLNLFKKIIAIEPTPELAKICREKGFDVYEKSFEDLKLNKKVDVITAFEVIEHIFDPKKFILKANSILTDKGIMVVTCPNGQSLEIACLNEQSDTVDNEHINLFNPKSLTLLFKNCGFEVLEISTPGKLDVELIKSKGKLNKDIKILTDKPTFQKYLIDNNLSSHMWLVAQKKN